MKPVISKRYTDVLYEKKITKTVTEDYISKLKFSIKIGLYILKKG